MVCVPGIFPDLQNTKNKGLTTTLREGPLELLTYDLMFGG